MTPTPGVAQADPAEIARPVKSTSVALCILHLQERSYAQGLLKSLGIPWKFHAICWDVLIQPDTPNEVLKSGVRAQGVESGINLEPTHHRRVLLVGLLEPQ